ncbi:MAG: hypothetical protein NTU58_03380 [Candidatus Nealsonbacteria bacterium]|nr:hypothetical protein [Candidatus Nealsonbacteria bacterium]
MNQLDIFNVLNALISMPMRALRGDPLGILFVFFACLLIFLIFRAFLLWYWKISRIEKLLEEIAANTKKESKSKEEFPGL